MYGTLKMVDVAQLVRALVCGTRGRGFESHLPPTTIQKPLDASLTAFFVSTTEPNLFERRVWMRKKMKCEALQLLDGDEGPCGKQYGNAQHEVRAQSQISSYLSRLVLVQRPIHQFFPKRTDFFKFIEFKGRIGIFCNPHQNIRGKMLNHFISNYLQHQT